MIGCNHRDRRRCHTRSEFPEPPGVEMTEVEYERMIHRRIVASDASRVVLEAPMGG